MMTRSRKAVTKDQPLASSCLIKKKDYEGFYLITELVDGCGQDSDSGGETIETYFNHIITGESIYPYSLRLTAADEEGNDDGYQTYL